MRTQLPVIFEYIDFKKYLEDYYSKRKSLDPAFSHSYICHRLGQANSKSYFNNVVKGRADLLYTKKKPGSNPNDCNTEWLINGPIDKPAYFVCRIDKAWQYRKLPQLRETRAEYGYVYFVREAGGNTK
ncbi:MAG TPA: hypothetical protein VKF42_00220 [Chitinivibrionales bacterium]|jgi:hypothetical protein|nr:hypothetical protein [Chitinivibrionales bacterium]